MSHSQEPCGQHLLIHGAGSTAYVVPISKAEARKIGLADRQSGDEPLPIDGVYEILDYYSSPARVGKAVAMPAPKDRMTCPACNGLIRRQAGGNGWSIKRCDELRRVHEGVPPSTGTDPA